tara:strand:+ start:2237 stop:3067 length:831 start_codon:yes stop_codon:yes gene_type:complete
MVQEDTQAPADDSTQAEEASAGEGDKTQETNWEERAAKAEALVTERDTRIAKQADDLRSAQGQARRQDDITELIGGFNDRFDGMEAEFRSRFNTLATGQIDTMDADADAARAPFANRVQATKSQRLNERGMAAIDAELDNGEGTPLLDKQTAPELEQMRLTYNEGVAHLNAGRFEQFETKAAIAANLANRAARAEERAAHRKAMSDQAAASQAATDKALEEAGVDDMTGGKPAAGGGTITKNNIDNMMANIGDYDAKTQKAVRDKYRGLMATGRFS